jgi:DNA-binding winged helix-turn-helix (wHTH) protein
LRGEHRGADTRSTIANDKTRDGNAVSISPPETGVWRFDAFVLDTQRYELRSAGEVIRVEPQVFDVLTYLVRNSHRFVTKEELFDSVWGGRFVGEAALTSRIKAARRAIGDDGESQRYIRTVRGRGYQFVGRILADAAAGPLSNRPRRSLRRVNTSRFAVPPTAFASRTRWWGRDHLWCGRPIG